MWQLWNFSTHCLSYSSATWPSQSPLSGGVMGIMLGLWTANWTKKISIKHVFNFFGLSFLAMWIALSFGFIFSCFSDICLWNICLSCNKMEENLILGKQHSKYIFFKNIITICVPILLEIYWISLSPVLMNFLWIIGPMRTVLLQMELIVFQRKLFCFMDYPE